MDDLSIFTNSWNEQHAEFLAEYARLVEQEGVALEEFRTFLVDR